MYSTVNFLCEIGYSKTEQWKETEQWRNFVNSEEIL